MSQEVLIERFFETLINGDRPAARAVIQETIDARVPTDRVISQLFWPTHEMIEKLHRADQMTTMSYHLATRLFRSLVDQAFARLPLKPKNGKSIFAVCGPAEGEELGAQMTVDLLEANGYAVTFGGGGVPADEILAQVHEFKPNVLLMFCSAASDLPEVRRVIDTLREIGACPNTQIVVGGGVFNRAQGLAEEIGADLWVTDPMDLLNLLEEQPHARATMENVNLRKKRRAKAA